MNPNAHFPLSLVFTFWLWLTAYPLSGQETLNLAGTVVDAADGTPLPFAHIHYAGYQYGSATNTEGRFRIRISAAYRQDTLVFSYVGYAPYRLPLSAFDASRSELNIALEAATAELPTIEVLSGGVDAGGIVRRAIERIPDNYAEEESRLRGFYRETIRQEDRPGYLLYAEGVLDTYKFPYKRRRRADRICLEKGYRRALPYAVQADSIYELPMLSEGAHMSSILDIVRNRDFLINPLLLDWYELTLLGRTVLDGRILYEVGFRPDKERKDRAFFEGTLLIDVDTYALVRLDFRVTEQARRAHNRSAAKWDVALTDRRYDIQYFPFRGKWQLQRADVEQTYRHGPTEETVRCRMYYVVTEIDMEDVERIRRRDALDPSEAFMEMVEAVDSSYWEAYNILPPEEVGFER